LLLFTSVTTAEVFHGDIHERILKISKEIKKDSSNAYLYFKRARLYYQHEDYKNSLKDLNKSSILGISTPEQELLYSKTFLKLKDYNNSIYYAQKVLNKQPRHVRAIKLMALNYQELSEDEKSAIAYQNVIDNSTNRLPENYVDASIAWEKLNNEVGYENAEKILRKGIDDLGQLISFYDRLLELAINQKNYDKAIGVQKEIIPLLSRKEFAYFKLTELYQLKNDRALALESLNKSKSSIKKIPQRSQNTSFIKELIKNIKKTEALLLQIN
jgi:tetratricopeptide (TPR) repeat protein